jgi:hypothetical protein
MNVENVTGISVAKTKDISIVSNIGCSQVTRGSFCRTAAAIEAPRLIAGCEWPIQSRRLEQGEHL